MSATTADGVRVARRERRRELYRAILRSRTFLVGAGVVGFWVLDALLWRVIVPQDPQAITASETLKAPSTAHWFGTDNVGRDVFSRVLAGAAAVLTVAPLATLLGVTGGIAVGLVAGYYRGIVDDVVSRLIDALLSFPLIIIAVLVLASLGRDTRNVILVIAVIFIPIVGRTVRSAVLVEREREYVAAARLRGERGPYIMVAEILPNITGPILVETTIRLGYAIFTAATLSFFGLGLQPPSPDWGLTIASQRAFLQVAVVDGRLPGARACDARGRRQPARRRAAPGGRGMTVATAAAVEIDGLTISYRRRGQALRVISDLSLTIRPGEAYGLVGESGCGKTTVAMRSCATCRRTRSSRAGRSASPATTSSVPPPRPSAAGAATGWRWSTRIRAPLSTRRSGSVTRSPRSMSFTAG